MSIRPLSQETFSKDVAKHQMTVLLDQDEHRHLRFAQPNTSEMHFHIVTWPGYLAFSGDMGCYVFARTRDMFTFFRRDEINPRYWSEKVQAADKEGVKGYDPSKLRAYVEEYIEEWPKNVQEEAREEILPHADDEHAARKAIVDFECDGHEFYDSWEADFKTYTFRFLWCCYAVVWAIQKYDAARPTMTKASHGG